jgi:hypothetical protein
VLEALFHLVLRNPRSFQLASKLGARVKFLDGLLQRGHSSGGVARFQVLSRFVRGRLDRFEAPVILEFGDGLLSCKVEPILARVFTESSFKNRQSFLETSEGAMLRSGSERSNDLALGLPLGLRRLHGFAGISYNRVSSVLPLDAVEN